MIAWLANHFFYCSLKKNSDEMVELAKNISRKTPDEISEFISNLGGIISGHNEFSRIASRLGSIEQKIYHKHERFFQFRNGRFEIKCPFNFLKVKDLPKISKMDC